MNLVGHIINLSPGNASHNRMSRRAVVGFAGFAPRLASSCGRPALILDAFGRYRPARSACLQAAGRLNPSYSSFTKASRHPALRTCRHLLVQMRSLYLAATAGAVVEAKSARPETAPRWPSMCADSKPCVVLVSWSAKMKSSGVCPATWPSRVACTLDIVCARSPGFAAKMWAITKLPPRIRQHWFLTSGSLRGARSAPVATNVSMASVTFTMTLLSPIRCANTSTFTVTDVLPSRTIRA